MHNILEIKYRLQYIIIGIISNILVCYYYKNNFINICLKPLLLKLPTSPIEQNQITQNDHNDLHNLSKLMENNGSINSSGSQIMKVDHLITLENTKELKSACEVFENSIGKVETISNSYYGSPEVTEACEALLISTSVPEVFIVTLITIIKYSLIATLPIIYYNMLVYMKSGLYNYEYIRLKQLLIISFSFFIISIVITCVYILPFGLTFFINEILNMHIVFTPQLSSYLGFIGDILLYTLIGFQIPVFFVAINSNSSVQNNIRSITKLSRSIIYFLFILISTIITPPDVFSQIFLSIIFIFIFELLSFCLLFLSATKSGH